MIEVATISQKQAQGLRGKTFAPDSYFNPIQDTLGNWIISKEEITQCENKVDVVFVKQLPLSEYRKKQDDIKDIDLIVKNDTNTK